MLYALSPLPRITLRRTRGNINCVMNSYVDENGIVFTDADIEQWAEEAEKGFPNSEIIATPGHPWEAANTPMVTRSLAYLTHCGSYLNDAPANLVSPLASVRARQSHKD